MNGLISALFAVSLGMGSTPGEIQALMDRIEARVSMPPGASPLALYERYYAWEAREDGVRKVFGTYVRGQGTGRHWVNQNELPLVMDGGCDIITLTYDVDADRVERVECNGDA